ncbi:MAG: hypothetical protein H5T64_11500 [Chloroflexi bacterium]|nr:hypothetical protein [Chloroflexota bacterium]
MISLHASQSCVTARPDQRSGRLHSLHIGETTERDVEPRALTARAGALLLCLLASAMAAPLGCPLPCPDAGREDGDEGRGKAVSPPRGIYEPEDTIAPL